MMNTYKHKNWSAAKRYCKDEPMREIIKEWEASELLFTTIEIISFWFEEVNENLVPDHIRFMCSYQMPIWLEFWEQEQILLYQDTWKVTNNQKWWRSPQKCKLEKKKLRDVKVWDFVVVVDVRWSVDNEKSYVLVTNVLKDWYEWMFYNNRYLCYMCISALSDDIYVVVPLDNY